MIAERFPPDLGGVARSAGRTAAALGDLGAEVHVLAWTKALAPGTLETEGRSGSGPVVHRLGLFANLDLSLQHTMNVLEWLHGRHRFDAAWGHYLHPAGFLAVVFAEWAGLPATVSARGNDVDRMMFPPGDFARLTWTLGRARVVSAVSHDLARKIGVLLGGDPGVEVIANAVDLDTFAPGPPEPTLREAAGILPGEAVLGFCGELRHKKGLPFLLGALREVRRSRPACLLVIGEVRPREQAHLTAFAAEEPGDAARILMTGHLPEPREVARRLRLCDVVLQPSMWDGLPNAVLEAMACGCVVVASDAGGIPEALEHGRSGFLVPRASLHRLGEATLEVLDLDPRRRAALAAEARRRVAERFHPDVEAAALRRVVARLIPSTSS
jgi:glycosyltransferase involved in cell wall biosynthesis